MVEVLIGLVFLTILAAKFAVLFEQTSVFSGSEAASITLEDQARVALDRIAYAVMGSDRESLDPNLESPAFSADIEYKVSLGVVNGVVVWGEPEQIQVPGGSSELVWAQNPGDPDERRVVWSRLVAPLLEGELPNGVDDNGNGLIDEQGLTFVLTGNSVEVTLTLSRPNEDGPPIIETVTTVVTCRRPMGT